MVFVGRPALWGLTFNGEEGVKKVLTILRTEFENTLLLTGEPTEIKLSKDLQTVILFFLQVAVNLVI